MTADKAGRSRAESALRLAPWLILISLLGAGASLRYTVDNLGINTDTADMLSDALPFRRAYERYRLAFPQHVDQLVVVIDGRSPELSDTAATRLADVLRRQSKIFSEVYSPGADPFFRHNALLYLSESELTDLSERLLQIQPFIGRITSNPSISRFVATLGLAIEQKDGDQEIPLDTVFTEIEDVIVALLDDRDYRMSWQRLIHGADDNRNDLRRYIFLKPDLDFSEPLAAEPSMIAVRTAARDLGLNAAHGVTVRVTGDAALGYEELVSAMDGAITAGIVALFMVTGILMFGLRSVWLMVACLTTLITGLIFTAGFATAALGHLNLISIAFAVLYIGLGVDYAIHVCLRYRDHLQQGDEKLTAIANAIRSIRGSLILCALTTATAFFAFVPTSFSGVSELGLISGTGMFVNLALSLALLPACLAMLPTPPATNTVAGAATYLDGPLRFARQIKVLSVVLAASALVLLPQLKFDRNPLNLRDADSESVTTLRELMRDAENPGMSITILTPDVESKQALTAELRELAVVRDVISADSFVPEVTDSKLELIDDLALLLGSSLQLSSGQQPPESAEDTVAALQEFAAQLHLDSTPAAQRLASRLNQFLDALLLAPVTVQAVRLQRLRSSLFGNLGESLSRLQNALHPGSTTWSDLPEQLRHRWINSAGLHRLAVYPAEDIDDNAALRRFVEDVQAVAPDATDEPVLGLRAGDAVVDAFLQAFGAAFIVISGLLFILLRDLRTTVLIISPLVLASLLTMGVMAGFSIPFNFANVIALPLLFGIGVDHSIHMVRRARGESGSPTNPLRTSTARAVLLSSLTTLCSFVNLLYSPHPGTASMGLLLSIGIGLMLFSTLVVLPALLRDRTT